MEMPCCGESRCRAVVVVLVFLVFTEYFIVGVEGQRVLYEYVRYPFKKKPKFERQYKINLRQCEQNAECSQVQGLDLIRCGRMCIAPDCYQELYAHDELELGEVDVRLTSFKGCWVQRYYR
ncbi:uncharacterized protein LOC110985147 [Acanthaster planci]|uniref:Uncharacterized protein LOC110985147 n=1 Tax=Acanthaster planci TaxID=133434 RepID=A0A8B7ZA10_ACAPL|nr:uncharacterized protein LOC110985147 [Acanthaster planci]